MYSCLKFLVVDDEYDKVKYISNLVKEYSNVKVEIKHCTNSKDAIFYLKNNKIVLLIIDLQIPEIMGDDIDPDGGVKLLEYIEQYLSYDEKPKHILGITQHQASYDSSIEKFHNKGWMLEVRGLDEQNETIKQIIQSKIDYSTSSNKNIDIAIITGLEHIELEAVLRLPCNWNQYNEENDCHIYHKGAIELDSGEKITLIAVSCIDMGIAHSASLSMKVALKFKPSYVFMVGICAGLKGKVNIGDIIIAEKSWDWGSGKRTLIDKKPVFLPSPNQVSLDTKHTSEFKKIVSDNIFLSEIYNNYPARKPNISLKSYVGCIATGAAVLEDSNIIHEILSHNRNLLGIEMEAYGVMQAIKTSSAHPPTCIVIKSVCDFADTDKNDDWQHYSSYTSAQFAFLYIKTRLVKKLYEYQY